MKLHHLELQGFGPYLERQHVDFDAFAGDGIFLIAGRTGAGKSSILDGVCFALYGLAPRYDGTPLRLRSDHCGPDDITEVVLEFTVAGSRFRATRAPEYQRPKRRGGGVTTEGARAQLDEWVDGRWQGRAVGPRDVGLAFDEILGLTHQQFLQVILLAQNRFQRFLLARNDERQALLRTLFGSRVFEEYEKSLEQRRRDAETAAEAGAQRVALHLADADDLIAEHGLDDDEAPTHRDEDDRPKSGGLNPRHPLLDRSSSDPSTSGCWAAAAERIARAERCALVALDRALMAAVARDTAEEEHRAASAAHAGAVATQEKRQQRTATQHALDALTAAEPSVSADRSELDAANRAETLRAPLDAADRASRALAAAAGALAAARRAWADGEHPEVDPDALPALLDVIAGDLVAARAAIETEHALGLEESIAAAASTRVVELEGATAEAEVRCAAITPEGQRLDIALRAASIAAGALIPASERLDAVTAALASARHAEQLASAVGVAETTHAERSGALEHAVAAVTGLLRRRLAGHAGELAALLVDGEACAVCGSTAHPRPAPPGDDPVSDAMIDDAESARDAAARDERAASDAARNARSAHADAAARSGGEAVATLERAHERAASAVAEAVDATERCEALVAERERLEVHQAEVEAELSSLTVALRDAREQVATASERAAGLRRTVEAALGGFATVRDRVDVLEHRRDSARAWLTAFDEHTVRSAAALEARIDCDLRLTGSAFADVAAAVEALRDVSARTTLDGRIRVHENALHAQSARLHELDTELAGAADDDPVATARAHVETRTRWDAAVTAAATADGAAGRLGRIVDRAIAAREEIAELADEHAAVSRLANTVSGRAPNTHRMTLEAFVLAAELEQIVTAANVRLHEMSSGRYRLLHTDARAARNAASGLGIEVFDAYTGQSRPAQSLSGGETFLASLALALGLAEVVTARAGGVRLDTLFIDEGFGSLDAETLDLAMATLDELRQGGRTVGVISHVAVMKEQLPAQLIVEATSTGASVIRQGAEAFC